MMVKEYATLLRRSMMFADIGVVAMSFVIAYLLVRPTRFLHPSHVYGWFAALFTVVWAGGLGYFGMYESFRVRGNREAAEVILKTALLVFLMLGAFIFMLHAITISRILVMAAIGLATLLLVAEKFSLMAVFRRSRVNGYNYRRVLVVGTGPRAQRFLSKLEAHAEWGFSVIGLIDENPALVGERVNGYAVLGAFADIPKIIHTMVVDDVVFVVPRSWLGKIEPLMRFCETEGVKVSLAVDFFDVTIAHEHVADFDGIPLVSFTTTTNKLWHLVVKRLIDIVASGVGLLVLWPLFLMIAIAIQWTSPGPVFFAQERCGMHGRRFTFYKFRTMVNGAERLLPQLLVQNEMRGPAFKMSEDPRVTPLGRFLRKMSLDELPQLWNVLRGDMSLVGPRPPLPQEVQAYDSWQRRKLSMRPGVTCLWQITGRNNITDFDQWVKLDLSYIDNWSLALDGKILLKTVPVVVLGDGAK